MSARKVSGTITAWMSSRSDRGPDDLNGDLEHVISSLSFSTANMENIGWTRAGTAEITVTLVDTDTLITNKVTALKSELQRHRAASQQTENAILERINNLLAITYKPEEA